LGFGGGGGSGGKIISNQKKRRSSNNVMGYGGIIIKTWTSNSEERGIWKERGEGKKGKKL